jgi:hypothetical protein
MQAVGLLGQDKPPRNTSDKTSWTPRDSKPSRDLSFHVYFPIRLPTSTKYEEFCSLVRTLGRRENSHRA